MSGQTIESKSVQRRRAIQMGLLDLLKEYSFKRGNFTLASGKKSDFYLDCKQAFLRSNGLWLAAQELEREISKFHGIEGVAGEGVGGIPLATAVTMYRMGLNTGCYSELHLLIVRKAAKDHGTEQKVEAPWGLLREGSRVVLVEDVLTTGGSAMRAVEALEGKGFEVAGVIALVDRQEGAEELFEDQYPGIELKSLYQRKDFF